MQSTDRESSLKDFPPFNVSNTHGQGEVSGSAGIRVCIVLNIENSLQCVEYIPLPPVKISSTTPVHWYNGYMVNNNNNNRSNRTGPTTNKAVHWYWRDCLSVHETALHIFLVIPHSKCFLVRSLHTKKAKKQKYC